MNKIFERRGIKSIRWSKSSWPAFDSSYCYERSGIFSEQLSKTIAVKNYSKTSSCKINNFEWDAAD